MSSLIKAYFGRMVSHLKASLQRRVVWVTTERRVLSGQSMSRSAFVAILGVEHYEETRRSYPVSSYLDLVRVLALESSGRSVLSLIGSAVDGRREVRFFRLYDPSILSRVNALWCVPETVLVGSGLASGRFALVERESQRYFIAASGVCQKAGGLVDSPERFRMAAGLPASSRVIDYNIDELRDLLTDNLPRLNLSAWLRFINPDLWSRIGQTGPSTVKMFASVGVAYLVLSSCYLIGLTAWRESQLNKLGADVDVLLQSQRRIDVLSREGQAISQFLEAKRPTWPLWQVVAASWASGGEILTISLADNKGSLRMQGQDATVVLDSVARLPGVEQAKFDSSVVVSQFGNQSFNIGFSFDGRKAVR